MKRVIMYYKDSSTPNMSSVHLEDAETSACLYVTEDQKHLLKFVEDNEPTSSTNTKTEELIALKKGGFTADEIIELKQSKLL